jgi:DNA-binding NarL/FixJ family response regulator
MHRSRPRIPIFVFSGYNDPDLAAEAMRLGAQGYIVKDHVDGPELVSRVRSAIDHRRKFSGKKETAGRHSKSTGGDEAGS